PFQFFLPMVVRVLDADGNPIGNKPVNWTLVSSQGSVPNFAAQTFTDGNGIAQNTVYQGFQPGNIGFPFLQNVLTSSAEHASVTFEEAQGLALPGGGSTNTQVVFAAVNSPGAGTTFAGTTGAPSATKINVHVDAFGLPVPNVSVRLLNVNDPSKGASVSCATGAGADPGGVLTDSAGNAVCTVVFGPIAGSGSFTVIVGGVDPLEAPDYVFATPGQSFAYYQSGFFFLDVKAGVPGQIQISSGNNQNVNAGQAAQPLAVKVTDAGGNNTISGPTAGGALKPASARSGSPPTSTPQSSGPSTP